MEGESHDWELLQGSGSAVEDISKSVEEIDQGAQGLIRPDYFSLDNLDFRGMDLADDASEDGSVGSGNTSWIEPRPEAPYGRKHPSELWSDSSSDPSDDRKLVDCDVSEELRNGLGMREHERQTGDVGEYSDRMQDNNTRKYWSDSAGDKLDFVNSGIVAEETDSLSGGLDAKEDESMRSGEIISGNDPVEQGRAKEERSCGRDSLAIDPSEKSAGGGEKKGLVWWKIPIELLKYCVFKVNPVWSLSMAAAVMGFVILGRRLYKMKKTTRSLQLKVTVDDKKTSQLVSRAPRLNDAISMVKRVPIIRPALPAPALNHWPVVS